MLDCFSDMQIVQPFLAVSNNEIIYKGVIEIFSCRFVFFSSAESSFVSDTMISSAVGFSISGKITIRIKYDFVMFYIPLLLAESRQILC